MTFLMTSRRQKQGIDVFDDVTSTKTRNKVRRIKTADTLLEIIGTRTPIPFRT